MNSREVALNIINRVLIEGAYSNLVLSNELNEQENLRKQLTGDIAHEIRTPLTSIKGHLDAIILGIWEPTTERLVSINE